VDPYLLTFALFEAAGRRGLRVFDRTTVTEIEQEAEGVMLHTERGSAIKAKYVVFAAGYEAQEYLQKQVTSFRATYALASEPVTTFSGWGEDQCLIWESARPYLYMRTTADGRIMMGGEDDRHDPERARDRRLPKKTARLVKRFNGYFPDIEMEPAYAWAGAFGETEDGLAYIGAVKEFPRSFFALGYGGNGITYSLIAAEIIRDAVLGHANADARIFSFDRAT
jgi:glycine/D-amino acid oxidase-like deaminating enzyme